MLMKESSTYQAILEEGRTEGAVAEAKKYLRIYGDAHFGPPDARSTAAIERINDPAQLEDLYRRSQTARSWQELFGPANAGLRKGRNKRRPPP
jgi:hypothetical protein